MKKQKINIAINALQHLAIKTLGNGKIVPYLSHSTFIGDMCDPCYESDLPMEEALNRLIEQQTRGENHSITNSDRDKLLSNFLAIQNLVKDKIVAIKSLPEYEGKLPSKGKKKLKH